MTSHVRPTIVFRLFGTVVGTLGIAGCLGWRGFRADIQRYTGGNVAVMVERFGAPNRTVDLPGSPPRLAYTWAIANRGNQHVCDVTAIAEKESGNVVKVTDNCPNAP